MMTDIPLNFQFLAVEAHPHVSSYHKLGDLLIERGIIQIWCLVHANTNESMEELSTVKVFIIRAVKGDQKRNRVNVMNMKILCPSNQSGDLGRNQQQNQVNKNCQRKEGFLERIK